MEREQIITTTKKQILRPKAEKERDGAKQNTIKMYPNRKRKRDLRGCAHGIDRTWAFSRAVIMGLHG